MIVVDTSVVYALADRRDDRHRRALEWYTGVDDDLATTPLVVAETDLLIGSRGVRPALEAFRRDVAANSYAVEWWPTAAAEAVAVAEQYADLRLSLVDASLVALAARLETASIATFDERHFRAVRPLTAAKAFRLLPADA